MAEQILTQVEVDALLKGLTDGEIKTEAPKEDAPEGKFRPYDFTTQEKVVRSRIPALDMINEKFCRSIRGPLFNFIRRSVDVTSGGVKIMKYEEFLKNLHVPSSLNVFQLTTLRGFGIMVFEPSLVFLIVDNYFGGDGRFHARIEGRSFTNVEQGVIKRISDVIFHEMNEAWKHVHAIDLKFVKAETNPQFVNIIAHSELVIVCMYDMEIEGGTNKFHICIPYSSIEPIKDLLYGSQKVDSTDIDKNWSASLLDELYRVPLSLSGEIGQATINVSEILNLKVGDIIQLEKKARDPLVVKIEGKPKLTAMPGVHDHNYALKILSAIKERG
ncbi:MAG: flagellar motor switch protein FliM [Deltaproteobacteria bacterium]|nr:flagellar motor switch protein FliM [Deltaproteobacteria bacterium]